MKLLFKYIKQSFFIFIGVISLVFFLFNILPADPARLTLGQRSDNSTVEQVRKDLNLDIPVWKRYFMFLNDLSPIGLKFGDRIGKEWTGLKMKISNNTEMYFKFPQLGRSYQSKKKVSEILLEALPGTILLATVAMCFATFIGILLGIFSALYKDTWIDQLAVFFSTLGISAPSFFAGILIAWLFGFVLHQYTHLNIMGSLYELEPYEGLKLQFKNIILPAFALGIRPMAIITQLTRNSLLDVLQQDYIRTAYAKGLGKWQVIFKHALRNAINPVITAISGWFAELLAGSFFIEYIFAWKGIGKVSVDALNKFDFPVIIGSVLLTSFIFVSISFLVDLTYQWIDPRIKYKD